MGQPPSGPLTDAATKFVAASKEAAPIASKLVEELTAAITDSSVPEDKRKKLTQQLGVLRTALREQRDPDGFLALSNTLVETAQLVQDVSPQSPQIAAIFSDRVKQLVQPYADFMTEHGSTLISANMSLQLIMNNPVISAMVLAIQTYQGSVVLDETIINAPANVAYAIDLLRQLTPMLLMMILLMSVAAVYLGSKVTPPTQQKQDESRMAEMAADFIKACEESVKASGDLSGLLQLDAKSSGAKKSNQPTPLSAQSERLARARELLRKQGGTPFAAAKLVKAAEPLTESTDPTTAQMALKVADPFLKFGQKYGMEISNAAIQMSAVASNPKISALAASMSIFVGDGPNVQKATSYAVNTALTTQLLRSLNPMFAVIACCATLAIMQGLAAKPHVSVHHKRDQDN